MTKRQKWQLGIGVMIGTAWLIWNTFFNPTPYEILMAEALRLRDARPEVKSFDGFAEPEMPGKEENNATLLGVDKDKNGIRDDVDIWINRTGQNYNKRMAMRQYASNLQYELEAAELNERDIIAHAESALYTSLYCLDFAYSDFKDRRYYIDAIARSLAKLIQNNDQRKNILNNLNNYSYSADLLVKDMGEDNQKACNFQIEKFSNRY